MPRHTGPTTTTTTTTTTSAGAAARVAAARAVHAVRDRGRSLDAVLAEFQEPDHHHRDRPLVHELCYGVLRTLPRLEALAAALLHRPLKPADRDLEALILVGLYQLTDTRIPPHAAVSATVDAAHTMGRSRAPALVNALLRRFQREREQLLAASAPTPEARWLFPTWLLTRLRTAWPQHWREIVTASNGRAPMTLRVNRIKTTRRDYAQRLGTAGLTAHLSPDTTHGLTLDRPVPTAELPGFADGLVSVQDAGAQLAAELLDAKPRERVLDACAAPGGKSAHILERAGGDLDLTALDSDPARLEQARNHLRRLDLSARIVQGDATAPHGAWAQAGYHRILLDAPCSATGVIRRHPDIKWLRRETDIPVLKRSQIRMLEALWPRLLPGGTLLYVTCSLLPAENEGPIRAFLAHCRNVRVRPLEPIWGLARSPGRQILPREGGPDGFYYAALEKCG